MTTMKRKSFFLALLLGLLLLPEASARYIPRGKWDFRAGVTSAILPHITYRETYLSYGGPASLYQRYGGYLGDLNSIGGLYLDAGWCPFYWLTVHVSAQETAFWGKHYDSMTDQPDGTAFVNQFELMLSLRFSWSVGGIAMLYAGFGGGMGAFTNSPGWSEAVSRHSIYSAGTRAALYQYEVIPLGVRVGKRLYGFAEFGIGSTFSCNGSGIRAGIGFNL